MTPRKKQHYHYPVRKRDRIKEYHRRNSTWSTVEKARDRQRYREYIARINNLPFDFTHSDEQFALEYWHGRCVYCQAALMDLFGWTKMHFEHYIPISYKGDDNPGTVPHNMLPCCSHCNMTKGATDPEKWIYRKFGKSKGGKIIRDICEYFEKVRRDT